MACSGLQPVSAAGDVRPSTNPFDPKGTHMTTITLPASSRRHRVDRPVPARPSRLAAPTRPAPTGFCYVAVNLSGRLSVLDGSGVFPLGRRTCSGTVYPVELADGVVCWLDADHLGGSINAVAGQICLDLSAGTFVGPDDAPFVCGPALFTGRTADRPTGLAEGQLRRILDAHAHAVADGGDLGDLDLLDVEDLDLGLGLDLVDVDLSVDLA